MTGSSFKVTRPAPGARAPRMIAPVGVAVLVALGATLVFLVDPNQPGHYPLCPFKALTGLDCPGCGSMRGIHDLLHGDVVGALDHNVLLALAIPAAVVAWTAWVRRRWTDRPRVGQLPPRAVAALIVLIVAFWILRNVPGVPFLGSA